MVETDVCLINVYNHNYFLKAKVALVPVKIAKILELEILFFHYLTL